MWDVWLYGIFALEAAQTHRVAGQPLLEVMRTPLAVNAGIFGALLVPLVAQARVRDALTLLSLACLLVFMGAVFTVLLLGACGAAFFSARRLQKWAVRCGRKHPPLIAGWIIVHAMYVPVFFLTLPSFAGYMTLGELSLLWGPAFAAFKAVHYIHLACKKQVDPFEKGAFRRFLLYMIHFASFRFGPFQKFRQFDAEVDTCKTRLSWRNRLIGFGRIALGMAKLLFIFHVINIGFFYEHGYTGPFAEELFANAADAEPGHLWLAMYLYAIRIMIFISALSDGVIGMNLMMGIRVPENSNWPVFARDPIEFWRRWHIQAGVFLRDEVFFPVGGLRKRRLGFFCVFAYSGFWHFPTLTGVLAFPLMQLLIFEGTARWNDFWERHEKKADRIAAIGRRLYLHHSPASAVMGVIFVMHTNVFAVMFIHDHVFGGMTMIPRMFGF